ncbi:MAG: hypothetical protein WA373_10270 [Burkholderiales bacterium]
MQRQSHNTFTALILFAMLIPIALADGYSRDPRLVGRWIYKGTDYTSDVTFAKDGMFFATYARSGEPNAQFEGKWLTDKQYLYWQYTKSSSPKVKPGARDKDTLVEITAKFLVLDTRDNRRVKYVRVK